ncbi:disease resistance protein At4g27190-like [Pistacia vera]|uniref:disease resistance protein At4g27190-like n=1 Tax=Pistacia vera TaxID=55513 RepID=UPI001262D0E8|nr:disease resistance protein At4g27190-like [Pistacia vera]
MIEVSRRNGEAIYEDVLKWLTNVEELVDDTRMSFEGFEQKENNRFFIGLCPDLRTCYHLSNKAMRQLKAVAEPQGEGVFHRVSYTIISPSKWLTSTKVYENFGSRMSTLQGLYNTLKDPAINIVGVYGMGGIGKTVLVNVLDEEEGFSLFKKITGDSAENHELQSLGIDIAKACGGLPLAIASIAIALRGKGLATWRNALRSLRRPLLNNFTGILVEVYSSIELSYNLLKGEELKSTFLLCSIMEYSGDVSIMELLKYGMGLGLFKEISRVEEAQNRVFTLIHELKCSCLLLDGYSNEWFSIHDVVRLVAISIASRDQHTFILRNEATNWLDKDALRSCKAIFIRDSNDRELPEGLESPHLNFFNLLARNPFMKIPDNFFTGMTKLTIINLTKMQLSPLPFSLCLLVNLRTLCLDQCKLGNIAGIGDLKNLEILSLSHPDIKFLPKDIGQLTQLRIFVQWEVEGLNFEGRNASLDELKHLSELTSLEIHSKDANILPRDLVSKLKRYRIFIGDEWDWFSEYGTLRTLKLKVNASIFPKRGITRQLNGIEELYLEELLGVNNVLYQLDGVGFSQLKHLHIQNNSSFQCIVDPMDREPSHAFLLLESLSLQNLINLEMIFKDGIEEIYATESKDDFEDIYDDDSEDDIDNNEVIDKIAIKLLLESNKV